MIEGWEEAEKTHDSNNKQRYSFKFNLVAIDRLMLYDGSREQGKKV